MGKFLNRKVNVIFLMLGNSCNMNCSYCMQHDLVNHSLSSSINPDIYDFIKEVSSESNGVRIQFYGGEPLLYFNAIKEVVDNLKDTNVKFSCLSNGLAVSDEIVDFFNSRDIPFSVSWDGDTVLDTRHFDVFSDKNPQKDKLLNIKLLGLSAVLSAKAYPNDIVSGFMRLDNEYYAKYNYHLRFNTDLIFNTGGLSDDLVKVDYDRVEREMFDLISWYLEKRTSFDPFPDNKTYAKYIFIDLLVERISNFYCDKSFVSNNYCVCGNGYSVLNMDLDGKLYPCHNTSDSCGSIYDSYFSYLNRIIGGDKVIARKSECDKCVAVSYCRGGCKLIPEHCMEDYCNLRKAYFLPVISCLQKYGSLIVGDKNA